MSNSGNKPAVLKANEGHPLNIIGNSVTLKLSAGDTNGAYYVFHALTPPGGGVPPHVHQHEDEIIYVLAGEYEFFLGGKTYRVTAGGTVNFPRRVPHGFTNVGQTPGQTLWTIVPGANFDRFFAELGALASRPAGPAEGGGDF